MGGCEEPREGPAGAGPPPHPRLSGEVGPSMEILHVSARGWVLSSL